MKYAQLLPMFFVLILFAACTSGGSEPASESTPAMTLESSDSYPIEEQTMPETALSPYPVEKRTMPETAPADPYPANNTDTSPVTDSASPAQVDLSQITPQSTGDTTPREAPQPGVPDPQAIMAHEVSQDLAKRINADVSEVNTISVEEVEWSNSSLGCPVPGMNYLMVITPGYKITLEQDGQQYTYHTNLQGIFVLCGQDGQPTP